MLKTNCAFRRIVGLLKIQERGVLREAYADFIQQGRWRLAYEIDPSERELAIMTDILAKLPTFLHEYGITPLAVTPRHIRIADMTQLSSEKKHAHGIEEGIGGFYMENRQTCVVFATVDDLLFAGRIVHELMHLHSFVSITYRRDKAMLRRVGLVVLNEKGERYFHTWNEALIEELAKRFDRNYFHLMPSLREAVAKRDDFIAFIRKDDENADTSELRSIRTVKIAEGQWKTYVEKYAYRNERMFFHARIKMIWERNLLLYASREDIFRLFVHAAYEGRMLEIARLLTQRFGAGAMRRLAQETILKNVRPDV